jgi:hypothetical protein
MDRIRAKWNWASQKPLIWANLGLLGATVLVLFEFPSPDAGDSRLRLWSLILQLIGAWTVWRDLTSTARQFGKPGILTSTFDWLKAGFAGRKVVLLGGVASLGMGSSSARGKVRTTIDAAAPIEDRVKNLEALARQIDDSVDEAYKEIDRRADKLGEQIKAEAIARSGEVAGLRQMLESAVTANFGHLAFGAFWLAIGAILGTLAPEITKIVAGRGSEVWIAF